MKTNLGFCVVIGVSLALWGIAYMRADKRPAETDKEVIAATDELEHFSNTHPISYYDARRDPPLADAPWTVELFEDSDKAPLLWSEAGYSHLYDAVIAAELDFSKYPSGHEGHSSENK